MNGIVPLYYNMRKASPTKLNNKNIYDGLNAAFTYGNIGLYSNNISKIWNNPVFTDGTDKEKQEAIDIVKLLCMENNFAIDAAKTLYMPTRIGEFGNKITEYTNVKLPAFFEYAKDKSKNQVIERNNSFVNKLFNYIPNPKINTNGIEFEPLDYKMLMSVSDITCPQSVKEVFNKYTKEYRYIVDRKKCEDTGSLKFDSSDPDNLRHIYLKIRSEFESLGYDEETITNMLVEQLYGTKYRWKQLLWFCYGEQIVNNLKSNLTIKHSTKIIQCIDCGELIEVDSRAANSRCRCDECQKQFRRYSKTLMQRKYRQK